MKVYSMPFYRFSKEPATVGSQIAAISRKPGCDMFISRSCKDEIIKSHIKRCIEDGTDIDPKIVLMPVKFPAQFFRSLSKVLDKYWKEFDESVKEKDRDKFKKAIDNFPKIVSFWEKLMDSGKHPELLEYMRNASGKTKNDRELIQELNDTLRKTTGITTYFQQGEFDEQDYDAYMNGFQIDTGK